MNTESLPITLYSSRAKYIKLLLGSLLFVAGGVFLVTSHHTAEKLVVGWLCIGFFGLGVPIALKQLLSSKPRVVITDAGVLDHTLGVGIIEWSDINAARVVTIHKQAFITLALADDEKYLSRIPKWQKTMAQANAAMGCEKININLSGIKCNPIAICLVVNEQATRARSAH